ncbi:MAG TPA: TonB-dependent receptor [Sphingomicrobium sp.]|nr:TonB-dependent receptor [Sphingomicrobium sp.]
MSSLNARILASASVAVIAIAGLSGTANAQAPAPGPVTPTEAQACADLPTQPERDACIAAQARPEGTPEEAGDPATQPAGETAERQAESDAIVVTGSRIRRSAFTSPDPITIIDPELELKGGENDTAEILQTNPVAAGSFQITSLLSAGSFVTNGGVGAQTLSLRGLGAERTLVLVNGRRAGPAGTRGAIAGFDLNVIPSAIIQSVEVVKTGASPIYGSDAIAGVVNLLTRKATEGIDLRGFTSVPLDGGGETYNVSVSYGKDFGRGHLIGGFDYNHRNELERGDRDYLMCPEEFLFNPDGDRVDVPDPRTGEPRCNAFFANAINVSTRTLVQPPGSSPITFGTIQFDGPGDRLGEFLPVMSGIGFTMPTGFFPVALNCNPNASANPTAAQLDLCRRSTGLLDPGAKYVRDVSVFPELDRYTFWADGSFEVTDNIELVGEFLYNKRKTRTDGVRQLFFNQFTGSTGLPAIICASAAQRAATPNCSPTGTGDPLNAGFAGNVFLLPIVPVSTFIKTDVDYYRGVGGVRANLGGFMDGWRFDSYVQHSRSDGDYTNHRILDDAVDLQELRSRTCQPGQVTRVTGTPCMDIDFTDPRVLRGEFTPAERAFLFSSETGNTLYKQTTAEASLAGDLIDLPAGPAKAAIGVQWRRDQIDDTPGEITLSRNVWGQSVSGRTAGFSTSKEAFGEVDVPLLRDVPFFQSLNVSAAARLTDYRAERDSDELTDRDKNNWTYKLGLNWAVNNWLRFRGTYGTSFRAPALFEQFLADQTGFLGQQAVDPCINFAQRDPSDRIRQRCEALGLPLNFGAAGSSSALVSSGGGIGVLDPETSKAKTVSVVLTPDLGLWSGMRFSVAVDYFDIEVKNQVTTLGGGNIVFGCFESDNYPDDPLCSLFERDLTPGSPRFGQIITIRDPFININRQHNRGVDVTARINQDLGRHGTLSALGQMTWQIEDLFELFRGFEADDNGESGEPRWVGDFKLTWANGPWSLFYGLNVIGSTSDELDLRNSRAGEVCFNSPLRGGLVCPVYKLDAQFYHSASVTREVGERFTMTLGVNNLFDNNPPRISGSFSPISGLGQVPVFGTQYDLVGRRAFVSVRAKM